MKEKTLKLLFYLKRGTQSKDGKSPIMARLSVGRTMVQFSCKIACSSQLWDSRKSRLVGKSAEAVSVNAELDRLQLSVHRAFEYLQSKQGETVTAEEVKATLFGLNSDSQGLLYHLEGYLARFRERVGIDRSERRYKCILLFRKHFEAFIKHRYRVGDLPVQKVGRALVEDFEVYLSREKAFKLNTTAGYLSMLASLLKDLYKRHIIDTYPFLGYSIRWDVGSPRYITKEELLRIISLDETQLGDYELVSRDMFVFACYTGLSYTDIYHLTAEHLVQEGGMTWIRKPRIKTGNVCHIPLLPEAAALIEQYRGIHTRAFRHEPPKGYLLPIPGCDTINIHLKKMAKLCKINKCLTFHMARHSFSTLTLEAGIPIESIAKMMGHSSIASTQIYAQITDQKIAMDMDRLIQQKSM